MANHIRRPNGSVKPPTGFQAALGTRLEPELQPAVPGEVLQLHRAQEHRRAEPLQRIEADVLDAGRGRGVEVFALHGVAGHQGAAAGEQRAHEVPLEVDPLRRPGVGGVLQPLDVGRDLRRLRAAGDRGAEQAIGMEPARSSPARPQPAVERHCLASHEVRGAHLLDGGIPRLAVAQPFGAREASRKCAVARTLRSLGPGVALLVRIRCRAASARSA